jgi:hypothetical protein
MWNKVQKLTNRQQPPADGFFYYERTMSSSFYGFYVYYEIKKKNSVNQKKYSGSLPLNYRQNIWITQSWISCYLYHNRSRFISELFLGSYYDTINCMSLKWNRIYTNPSFAQKKWKWLNSKLCKRGKSKEKRDDCPLV